MKVKHILANAAEREVLESLTTEYPNGDRKILTGLQSCE
jgi:hypothetical protein